MVTARPFRVRFREWVVILRGREGDPMKRAIIAIILFFLLGMLTSIAVAWGIVLADTGCLANLCRGPRRKGLPSS